MVNPRTGVIIQARINSSRLPGKALLPLPQQGGQTILEHIIAKARAVVPAPEVILATSTNPENNLLGETARKNHIHFFQGDEADVLGRFYHAAQFHGLQTIVRLTGDNPFIDSQLLSQTLLEHHQVGAAYTSTTGLPLGTNLEIFSFPALEQAYRQASLPEHREHVTPYIRLNPGLFALHQKSFSDHQYGKPEWRLTIDNESDYALACALVLILQAQGKACTLGHVAGILQANPALLAINKDNYQKKVFTSQEEEITQAVALLQFYELSQAAAILDKHKP